MPTSGQMAREISKSLRTADRSLAKRRPADEMGNAAKRDLEDGKMTLEELVRLSEERLAQHAPNSRTQPAKEP